MFERPLRLRAPEHGAWNFHFAKAIAFSTKASFLYFTDCTHLFSFPFASGQADGLGFNFSRTPQGPEVGDGKRTARETDDTGPREAGNLLFADDSGAVPLNPLRMSLLSEISASTSACRRPRGTLH